MKRSVAVKEFALTFKQKLELAKLLDGAGVSVIEVEGIENPKVDYLRVKSIASIVKESVLAVPVQLDGGDIEVVWKALAEASRPRLQVQVSTSPARMEFIHKKKAPKLLEEVAATVKACAALAEVEFIADDATRTDPEYLASIIGAAIEAGAAIITVCDDAGTMLPEEFAQFVRDLRANIPQLADVRLAISCSNDLFMAESNAVAGIMEGVDEIKVASYPLGVISLDKICKIISDKGGACGVNCTVRTTALKRTMTQIQRICEQSMSRSSMFAVASSDDAAQDMVLGEHDDQDAVAQCVAKLGYDLSAEDLSSVYESFQRIASKKGSITGRELDAIVATAAMQVPETYKLIRYTLNSGNCIKASACIQMSVNGEVFEKVAMGDGPVDAAFAAIEDIVGKTCELDDWQMQSVTEGQKAMGEAVIKLMSEGKVYSGRGLSTDIIGSSIRAYINALNKVVYEEEN